LILEVPSYAPPIDDEQQVFMSLGPELAEKAVECMPQLGEYVDQQGRIITKVDKAMYGLIQSTNLVQRAYTSPYKQRF